MSPRGPPLGTRYSCGAYGPGWFELGRFCPTDEPGWLELGRFCPTESPREGATPPPRAVRGPLGEDSGEVPSGLLQPESRLGPESDFGPREVPSDLLQGEKKGEEEEILSDALQGLQVGREWDLVVANALTGVDLRTIKASPGDTLADATARVRLSRRAKRKRADQEV